MNINAEFQFKVTDLPAVQRVAPEEQMKMRELLQARDFASYLSRWSTPELSEVFFELISFLTDREFWPLLRYVWLRVETTQPDPIVWFALFSCARGERQRLMTPRGRRLLDQLPKKVSVFQLGDGTAKLAWTLDLKVALRLAAWTFGHCRPHPAGASPISRPAVAAGTCARKHILALFTEHGERTVIVEPRKVVLKPEHLWPRLGLS